MASRNYSADDYGTCRYMLENPVAGHTTKSAVDDAGASFTIARAERVRLLNLADGAHNRTTDGEVVRLAGLGVKTGKEAIRLGIAAV